MASVSYYAWFLFDYRPRTRPAENAHKQANIPQGTKVSVCEEYFSDGRKWLRIVAPAGFPADASYPDWWVPSESLTARAANVPGPVPDGGSVEVVPDDVVRAVVLILGWLKS